MKAINVFLACLALTLPSVILGQDCTALTEISDIEVQVTGEQIFVFWQEPTNIATCGFSNVEHTVNYTGFSGTQQVVTSSYFAFFTYSPYRCVPGTITITVTADEADSVTTTLEYYTETTSVENLAIVQTDDELVASWSLPEDAELCNFAYLVTYTDSENSVSETVTDLQIAYDVILASCNQVTVTVTPYLTSTLTQYEGVTASAEIEGSINAVRNYALDSSDGEVIANFDPPTGIEDCDITYEVRETEVSCFVKEVTVAAYNGRIYSEWVSDNIEVEISSVQDLEATASDTDVTLAWTEPLGASACGASYQVAVSGLTFNAAESGSTIPSAVLERCIATTVTVTPVSSTGKVGISAEISVKPDLGAVENLELGVVGNVVSASWEAPADTETCVLTYLLEYTNESGVYLYVIDGTSYTFEYTSCVDVTLSVLPHGEDGSEGVRSTITLAADCQDK